jgi:hypothetical protein
MFAGAWLATPPARGADIVPKISPIEKQKDLPVGFSADNGISYDVNTGYAKSNGPATITYGDLTIHAGNLEFNQENGDFAAKDKVRITRSSDNFTWEGAQVHGNIKTREFSFNEYRGVLDKLLMRGKDGTYKQNDANVFKKVSLTTCDLEKPHYHLSATSFTYYPDKTFKATNLVAWAGPIPIFYLPYLSGTLDQENDLEYKLGYNNKWGAIIGIGKSWNSKNVFMADDHMKTRFYLDERTKSGPGLENKTDYTTENSLTRLYMLGRFDRLATKNIENDVWGYPTDYYRGFDINEIRYRGYLFHRQDFSERVPGLTLQARGELLSDAQMLQDWGKGEYRRNPQSLSYAQLALDSNYFIVTGYARPKLMDFDTVTERLPELRIDTPRTNLFGSALQYQSSTDIASLNMSWRSYDDPQYFSPSDYDTLRVDSKHFFYLPFNAFNDGLQLTPRAGFDVTHYTATSQQAVTAGDLNTLFLADDPYSSWRSLGDPRGYPAQYDTLGGSDTRLIGEVGLELSSKFYRTWQDCKKDLWLLKLDGLRHVVQPYVNYTLTSDPNVDREHIPFFDETDQIAQQHFVQVGVRQRWQTRRNQRIFTFASLDAYTNIHIQDGYGIQDRDGALGDIGLRGTLRPTDFFTVIAEAVADAENNQINFAKTGIQYGDPNDWTVGLGYNYIASHTNRPAYSLGSSVDSYGPAGFPMVYNFGESQFVTANWNWMIKPSIGLKVGYMVAYDIMENRIARQGIMLQRDLHCWTGALQAVLDSDNQLGFFVVFTLKAYPQVKMGTSVSGLSNNDENQ